MGLSPLTRIVTNLERHLLSLSNRDFAARAHPARTDERGATNIKMSSEFPKLFGMLKVYSSAVSSRSASSSAMASKSLGRPAARLT